MVGGVWLRLRRCNRSHSRSRSRSPTGLATASRNTREGWMIAGGLIGLLGLHIWEVADAFVVPGRRNQRVRALRERLGLPPVQQNLSLFVTPPEDGSGAVGGLTLRF
jgi:hypothetical protein